MSSLDLRKPKELSAAPLPTVPSYGAQYAGEDKVHLREYWRSARKHLWLIIGITVLLTAIAAVYMARKPDVYEAEALVQVDLEDINAAIGISNSSSVVLNSGINDPAYFNTQLRILTSSGLLRRVVKTLDLERNQAFLNPQAGRDRSAWQSLLRMVGLVSTKDDSKNQANHAVPLTVPIAPDTPQEDTAEAKRLASYVDDIRAHLLVEPLIEKKMGYGRDNTRLINISYRHPDPQIAAKIVNTIADVLALSNLERKAETNTSTGDFLQKRVGELQSQIRSGEEQLINYAKNNQILTLDASQNTVIERLVGLNRQLLEAENERKLAETTYRAALAPGAASALAEEKAAQQIADSKAKLAGLRQRQAQLLVKNTAEWPEVKEINQEIAVLEREIKDAHNRSTFTLLTNLETRYRQVLSREEALRAAFNRQRAETVTQNEAAINYRIIQQEIETNKGLLNGLLQRYKENDVVLAGLRKNIHVIDYAVTPNQPVGPMRLQIVMLALVLSLAFGVCLAFFLEYLNDTVRSIDDVERILHLPALVAIPSAGTSRDRNARAELLIKPDANAPLAEIFRQLRTSVLLSTPGRAPRTLLVTSSLLGEGKTTTAVNLAVSLAQSIAKVLIIDADLRRPRLGSIFGLGNGRGLSTYLSSEMSEAELLAMVERCGESNLYVLTSGLTPPNPAELLGSEQMNHLLSTLASTFKLIIIDSPPVASVTDAVLLSSMVEGVLLVVHSGKTPHAIIQRSQQLLMGADARILGVVLNQVDLRSQDYYYQSYYQQSYKANADPDHPAAAPAEKATRPVAETSIAVHKGGPALSPTPAEPPAASSPVMESEAHSFEEAPVKDWPVSASESLSPIPDAVESQLTSEDASERAAGVAELSLLGGDDAFREICLAFGDPAQEVRDAAAHSLYNFNADHISSFTRAVREAEPSQRRNIGAAVASSGLANRAISDLSGENHEKSYAALSLLFLMAKVGEVQPLMRAIEEHPSNEVRAAVIKLLASSGQEETCRLYATPT
ncbi:MAG: polysaccharide biosynthesis tyrosine autokinase [Pyrinomonadaceae bacterium]|nr:polysaccharide biosynthesis tyrosine autokinase [Pyrinomonadaceae bacterium]